MEIEKALLVKMDLTPYDVAKLFAHMGSDEQAMFFNCVADIVDETYSKAFCFQMAMVTDEKVLNSKARDIMKTIGDYAEKS